MTRPSQPKSTEFTPEELTATRKNLVTLYAAALDDYNADPAAHDRRNIRGLREDASTLPRLKDNAITDFYLILMDNILADLRDPRLFTARVSGADGLNSIRLAVGGEQLLQASKKIRPRMHTTDTSSTSAIEGIHCASVTLPSVEEFRTAVDSIDIATASRGWQHKNNLAIKHALLEPFVGVRAEQLRPDRLKPQQSNRLIGRWEPPTTDTGQWKR